MRYHLLVRLTVGGCDTAAEAFQVLAESTDSDGRFAGVLLIHSEQDEPSGAEIERWNRQGTERGEQADRQANIQRDVK